MKTMQTWNTWDASALNAVMKVPEMAVLRVALYDDNEKFLLEEMLWRNVAEGGKRRDNIHRFGLHHPSGKYFDIDFKYFDFIFNMQFAWIKDGFVCKVTPKENLLHIKFFIEAMFRWNAEGTVSRKKNILTLESPLSKNTIFVSGDFDTKTILNSSHLGVMLNSSQPVYISCNSQMTEKEIDDTLKSQEDEYCRELVLGGGVLDEAPEAIIKAITWNTIYEPIKKRFCTPVSRAWCVQNGSSFGSYVLFEWDTFFAGLLSAVQDKDLAYSQIHSIFEEMTDSGMIPNFGSQRGSSVDRSQPPVGSYCILKLYRQFDEKEFLEEYFDKLLQWNSWWMCHRDGNGDGLLEWGSDPVQGVSGAYDNGNTHQFAMYESGLDNSPMYDSTKFNTSKHTLELADVGLNSLYALDCWALSEIAKELGKEGIYIELTNEYNRIKELINKELWNEELGIYCNKYWDGKLSKTLTPTNFYPLLAGVATDIQAKRMIEEHLLSTDEFWGEYIIPSVSRNHCAFKDNDYWRGRIWGPMNFLVSEGIKRYGFINEAYEFAKKSLALFMKEWKEENHIHENYNTITGDGDDKSNADHFYTWGALLAFTAVSEVVEAQPWGGLRFGNLSRENASIANYPIKDDKFTVTTCESLRVDRNGKPFIFSTNPLIIQDYKEDGNTIYMKLLFEVEGILNIYMPLEFRKLIINIYGVNYELAKTEQIELMSFEYK